MCIRDRYSWGYIVFNTQKTIRVFMRVSRRARRPPQARAGHGRRESVVFMGIHRVQYAENYSSFPIPPIGTSGRAPRPPPASSPHRQTFIDLVYVRMTRILHTDTTNIATIPRVDRRANTILLCRTWKRVARDAARRARRRDRASRPANVARVAPVGRRRASSTTRVAERA